MKKLRKAFFYLLFTITTLLIGLIGSVYFFKDAIIRQFIEQANEHIQTPVKIGKIDVTLWQDFPNLSIVFRDVYVEGSLPGNDTLLWARQVAFVLNPLEVAREKYDIKGLRITDSRTHLHVNPAGRSNYRILKENAGQGSAAITFHLKDVALTRTWVRYFDQAAHQEHIFNSEQLQSAIQIAGDLYTIGATGDVTTHQIGIGKRLFLEGKTFDVDAALVYDDAKKKVTIDRSSLLLGTSPFVVSGTYLFETTSWIDLTAEGQDTNIQTILSLFPPDIERKLSDYRSEGDVFFKLTLKGELSEKKDPFLGIEFGASNAAIFHPDYQSKITEAYLNGSFATPSLSDFSRAELFLKEIRGKLNNEPFQAEFTLQNFDDPLISLKFKGALEAQSILQFYPVPEVHNLSGRLAADFSFEGRTELLKNKATAQQIHTQGTVDMTDVSLVWGPRQVTIEGLNGSFQFNNNDLALSEVRGRLGKSDFLLNGHFMNVITFMLFENQPIGIEADLRSGFIDLDEMFALGFGERSSDEYEFSISPHVHLNFNCDIASLRYQKLNARRVKGNLLIKNQMAVSRALEVMALGGGFKLNGIIDAKNPKAIDVVSSFKLDGIHVDSIFYLFNNFDQDFILDKHLKGRALADVSLEMTLDDKLHLFPETLVADVSALIKNGELNNFEPLQALNKYLDDEGLARLRFADLKNDIHIENKTIYIPQMEIRSNVTTIQLSGTHTFDQHIDYHVVAPLRNKKKIDPDEALGAIEQDNRGQTKIFLKITGTTDDYKVSLDKDAIRKKVASDMKKEVQELMDAFRLKGKKKQKEAELSDETFDWDNPDQ